MTQYPDLQGIFAINQGNQTYQDNKERWIYLLASYTGGDTYKLGNYLTRYVNETAQDYQSRINATHLENHCSSVISVYTSFLFRTDPERQLGDLEQYPEAEEFLLDADLDGRSFNNFLKEVSVWSSVFGSCWIIVAKPKVAALTRADELNQMIRPYVSMVTPLMVLDWRYSRAANGVYQLEYFKYIEEINGSVHTIKEWTTQEIKTTQYNTELKEILAEVIDVNELATIPIICVYSRRSIVRGIGISDIQDIADAQRTIYNLNSEIEQSIRIDSHPSLVKTPETEAGSGAGAIIHMPDNIDPGLRPYILDYSGANIDAILRTKADIVQNIDKMANTGAVRQTTTSSQSGIAMLTEFQLLGAKLSEKADNLELAEESIWRLFCQYQNTVWTGTIKYPDSFNIRDNENDIRLLLATRTAIVNPKLINLLETKLVEYQLSEDELEEFNLNLESESSTEHPTTTSSDRSAHIQQMIMDGYTDADILAIHPEILATDIQAAKEQLLNL